MREVNTHKIIRIFLASSIDDTKEERDKLQNKILAVWNPIFNKFNIELKIFRCEQMTEEWLKRNQKTIDDEIRNSDVFIVIFKNTVGNYTFHEFEVARDCYSKTNGKPRIYPYISNELIKNIDKIPALQEITRDDNYPETFSVIDTIEISLLERLGKEMSLRVQPHYDGTITIYICTEKTINAPHRQPISFCEARTIAISTALTQATLALHKPSNRRCAVGASFVAGG